MSLEDLIKQSTEALQSGCRKTDYLLSLVTPAFCEEENLRVLYDRFKGALDPIKLSWEWIIVDDHSPDKTFAVAQELVAEDKRVRAVRFSRNFGSHAAITCGLHECNGDVVAILAADLQDPPEALPEMLAHWRDGDDVIWAVRSSREDIRKSEQMSSRIFYWIMRHVVGMREMPPTGADFLVADRAVVDSVRAFAEHNVSLFALISWVGFRHRFIGYEKQTRLHGSSGWTLRKKLKAMVDAVTAFSHLPIRVMSWGGIMVAFVGFLYAIVVTINTFIGHPVTGYASLMVAVLVIGGLQMTMLGILGEYIWRSLDEARRRPLYIIERRS
jgi:dolichol-phosphate mannosyltransferase